MNHQHYMEWLTQQLLPNIPLNSVIILDNTTYHNKLKDKPPTTANKMDEIKDWLRQHTFRGHTCQMIQFRTVWNHTPLILTSTLWTPHVYFESPPAKAKLFTACISPKAKLFSLQLNNQSKILFCRFLPFALSFSFVRALGEFIGTYSYQYDAEFTLLRVNAKVSF